MLATSRMGLTPLVCCAVLLSVSACGESHTDKSATGRTPPGRTTVRTPPTRATTPDSGLPAGIVAKAGGNSIDEQTLEHWIGVQAVIETQANPTRPVPIGLIPKPPAYRACIAYLAALARAQHARPAPDTAQVKDQCEQEHATLQRQVLETLIIHYWVKEEAARAGVVGTAREFNEAFRRAYPTKAGFRRFLAFTGLHASDERFLLQGSLLLNKWQRATLPVYTRVPRSGPETGGRASEVDVELQKLSNDMTARWTPRTHCGAGYVVMLCSEYHR